mgnify:CR=1 FL=1
MGGGDVCDDGLDGARHRAAVPLGVVLCQLLALASPTFAYLFNLWLGLPALPLLVYAVLRPLAPLALAALPTWGDGRVMLGAIEEQRKVATS